MKPIVILCLGFAFLSQSSFADTLTRVVPRSDYGVSDSTWQQLKDRWDQLGALLSGKPMGGDQDIVFQEEQNLVKINRCPTVRECFSAGKEAQAACFQESQKWSCEEIYEGTHQEFCEKYVVGSRIQAVLQFVGKEVLAGVLLSPVAFFQHGVGLLITETAVGVTGYNAVDVFVKASCAQGDARLSGGEQPTAADVSRLSIGGTQIYTEGLKGQVQDILEVFNPPVQSQNQGPFPGYGSMEESPFPKAVQIPLL